MRQKISWVVFALMFSCGQCLSTGLVLQKTAIGYYLNTSNNLSPLSYTTANGGISWSLSGLFPLPDDVVINVSQNSELQGTDCGSSGSSCSAVGFYSNNQSNLAPLGYTTANGGISWSLSGRFPLPSDVAANGIQNTRLQDVACDSTGRSCKAIGFYLNQNNNLAPLAYITINGGSTWARSGSFPLPSNVAANGIQNSRLQDIACDSTSKVCSAVGFYLNANNNLAPLNYFTTNGGTTWSLGGSLLLPGDVAANGIQHTKLQSVNCDSSGKRCCTVGFYRKASNSFAPLSYTTVNGGVTWTLTSALPLPTDVAANGIQNSELLGIACDSAGYLCRAVGFYRQASNNFAPLAYTSSNGGTTWSLHNAFLLPANVAANGIQNSELEAVNCDSSGLYCTTVGFYLDKGNNIAPLSYNSVNGGGAWSLRTPLPLPKDIAAFGSQNSVLLSVG